MALPSYVKTRTVSLGGAVGLENGESLSISAVVNATKGLIWNETGYRFEQTGVTAASTAGGEVRFTLPVTDQQGWRDPVTNSVIDVSATGAYTHMYVLRAQVGSSPQLTIGPFALPLEDGSDVDLDIMLPASTSVGNYIQVPDTWGTQISEARRISGQAAQSASAAAASAANAVALALAGADPSKIAGLGEMFGTESAVVMDPRVATAFMFGDDSSPVQIYRDGYLNTEELDTVYDIYEPGARAIWLYEDGSIGSILHEDGSFTSGADSSAGSLYILGDSLSHRADLTEADKPKAWDAMIGPSVGQDVKKYGRPGMRAAELEWMAGASIITGTVAGGTTGASFAVTDLSLNPFRAGDAVAVPSVGMLDDRTMIRGQLVRNGSTAATFISDDPTARSTTLIQIRSVAIPKNATLIFDAGTNDGPAPGGGATAEQVVASIVSVIDSRTGPTVVWSPLDRGVNEGSGTARGTFVRAVEAGVSTQRPGSWMAVRAYLASEQALTDAVRFDPTFTPSDADRAAVAAGSITASFRIVAEGATNAGVHPNVLGHALILWFMLNHLFTKGLV